MKRTLCLFGMLCLSAYTHAQQYWLITPKNAVKWNATALTTHTIALQYERVLADKSSIALGLNLMPSGNVPLAQNIRNYYLGAAGNNNEAAATHFANNAELSGWALTPEFRFYLGRKSHQGLYLAPYGRYGQYNFQWSYTVKDEDMLRPTEFDGRLSVLGGGLLIGHQWHFNNFLLDWWILGLSYNVNTLTINGATDLSDKNLAQKQDLKEYLEGITVNGQGTKANVTNGGAEVTGSKGLPGVRMGLCIGYRF